MKSWTTCSATPRRSPTTVTTRPSRTTQGRGRLSIVRSARRLSAIKSGDAGLVHVYPSNGQLVVERLFAGTSATQGQLGPGGTPPGATNPQGSGQTGTTSTT